MKGKRSDMEPGRGNMKPQRGDMEPNVRNADREAEI